MRSQEEKKEYQKQWRKKNRDRLREYNRNRYKQKRDELLPLARVKNLEYYYKHREEIREKQNVRNATPEAKAAARSYQLRKNFGITVEQYDQMLKKQDGVCALCCGMPTGRWNRLHVDHDHNTGRVRGLLCTHCNTAIGLMKDNPNLMEKAALYVRSNRE